MEKEHMKLTKEDLDKVRNIEGFPIGKDEDIIALSRPPYYTACPNPFIREFIEKNGKPYDEETDDYHCEPFAADVSEGKNDPIYNAHSYHTKVPHKAILRYVLHYTRPGDIVFDGFCGTGMTGVAAQMCGCPDMPTKAKIDSEMKEENIEWGSRKAILSDLSPMATFIGYNYNAESDVETFFKEAKYILDECKRKYSWMYKTRHVDVDHDMLIDLDESPALGNINCVIWSDVYICPVCSKKIVLWDVALDEEKGKVKDKFKCKNCGSELMKKDCTHAYITKYDNALKCKVSQTMQVPVLISYTYNGKRYQKEPDEYDKELLTRIEKEEPEKWVPLGEIPDGEKSSEPKKLGLTKASQLFTHRNLLVLSYLRECLFKEKLGFEYTSLLSRSTKHLRLLVSYFFKGGGGWVGTGLSGTMYIPSLSVETNPLMTFENKINKSIPFSYAKRGGVAISCNSATDLSVMPDNCIDYIFTDPPFGSNLNYSELSFMWESWLKVRTNNSEEAIMSKSQHKGVLEYQNLMEASFQSFYRVLKPNRWITIEFHNTKNVVWNAIQEGLLQAGFIVADVRTINKQQKSFNQVNARGAVKQDLVISAYKPKNSFIKMFRENAGSKEGAWEFVRQHLDKAPIAPDANNNGKIDIVAERCNYLLFDRMVAYHIVNGIPVPMDAHTFYEGLRQRFVERDGMFFNSDQVNEYDEKRLTMEVEDQQMALFVTDEKNAIAWLHQLLDKTHLSYQEIQPKYLQELHQDKREEIPELLDMLKENFVQDAAGKWYIPDLTDAADLAKLRRKKLLKEFYDSYAAGKQKIKVARQEAIRAGFDDCWAKKDYATIVHVGDRLPEAVLQEDQALLMYYDNASSRV